MTRSSVSLVVREAFPASNIDGFGQQLGVDRQDAVCRPSEARDKSAGYGRRWRPSSRRCRVPKGASRSRRHRDPGPASASRGRRQLLSCDVDKARPERSGGGEPAVELSNSGLMRVATGSLAAFSGRRAAFGTGDIRHSPRSQWRWRRFPVRPRFPLAPPPPPSRAFINRRFPVRPRFLRDLLVRRDPSLAFLNGQLESLIVRERPPAPLSLPVAI